MTRIGRIKTDNHIRAYPRNPRHQYAIGNADGLRHHQVRAFASNFSITTMIVTASKGIIATKRAALNQKNAL